MFAGLIQCELLMRLPMFSQFLKLVKTCSHTPFLLNCMCLFSVAVSPIAIHRPVNKDNILFFSFVLVESVLLCGNVGGWVDSKFKPCKALVEQI